MGCGGCGCGGGYGGGGEEGAGATPNVSSFAPAGSVPLLKGVGCRYLMEASQSWL